MATTYELQQRHETTSDGVNSFRESSQTPVDSIVPLQDGTMKVSQSPFLIWRELLTQQAESMHRSQQQWRQHTQKQQEAFQNLMVTSMQRYLDFLLAPFSFSQQKVKTAETAMQQAGEEPNPFDCVIAAFGG
jgi:hypothetical protein